MSEEIRKCIFDSISLEREHQEKKHGVDNDARHLTDAWWLSVLAEEVGEAGHEIHWGHEGRTRYDYLVALARELIQSAAVITAEIEWWETQSDPDTLKMILYDAMKESMH